MQTRWDMLPLALSDGTVLMVDWFVTRRGRMFNVGGGGGGGGWHTPIYTVLNPLTENNKHWK